MSEHQNPRPVSNGQEISLAGRFLNPRTIISLIVGGAFIYFIFTRLDVNLQEMWRNIQSSNPVLYILALVSYYASFPLRGLRWRLLLGNIGLHREASKPLPSSFRLGGLILISWFVNCILYGRLGDAYRAYLVKEDTGGGSFSKAIGTVLAERVLDMVVVFLLLLTVGVGLLHGATERTAAIVLGSAFGLVVLLVLIIVLMWRFGHRLRRRLPARFGSLYALFHEGTLGSFRQIPLFIIISLAVWALEIGRTYFVIQSLGFAVSLQMIVFVALAQAMLTTLPITPGGLGLTEAGVAGVLMLTLSREAAWSATLVDRSIAYLSVVLFGLVLFLYRQLVLGRRHAATVAGVTGEPVTGARPEA
ncbi:MAG: flippase-like domain-containing protein [Chloroflexi bacterium]|nr:flippase-like domain-containing protein [Chloroflexota bacterium]